MAIAARTTTVANSGTGNVSSLAPGYPTSTAANDLVLEVSSIAAGAAITGGATGPAALARVDTQQSAGSNGQLNVWEAIATSGDLSTAPTLTASSARNMCAACCAISGGTYESITDGTQVTGTTGATIPSVTPSKDNSLLVLIASTVGNTTNSAYTVSTPTGWTANGTTQNTTTTAGRIGISVFTQQLGAGTAGVATSTGTITAAASANVRWMLAVIVVAPANTATSTAASDTAAATDALTRQSAHPRALSDTATASDALTRASTHPRAATDTAAATDAASTSGSHTPAAADTATATDAVTRTASIPRALSDTASATDALTRSSTAARAVADTASASDVASGPAPPSGVYNLYRYNGTTLVPHSIFRCTAPGVLVPLQITNIADPGAYTSTYGATY